MSNFHRGHSIDTSYLVLVHLAKRFQRRTFFKSANQKQELPVVAMFVNRSGQNEQSLERTFHKFIVLCFCFVFLRFVYYNMLPVSLDCPFLIVPSVFLNVYFIEKQILGYKFSP
jgi:hypothetical protein